MRNNINIYILFLLQEKYLQWEEKTKKKLVSTQGIPVFDVLISVGSGSETVKKEKEKEKESSGVNPAMFKVGPLPNEEE